jgi:acetyl esterase/lipase
MRIKGQAVFPAPVLNPAAKVFSVPSRDSGRSIPCRAILPESGSPKGVFYHIHGGGWVLNTEAFQDALLQFYANACGCACVSVGYRLAPEDPYPAGNEDCIDVGEWLIDHAEKEYGGPVKFMGGESAGGHLSAVTCFELLRTRPNFTFNALILNYGCYDLAGMLPAAHLFDKELVLSKDIMAKYGSPSLLCVSHLPAGRKPHCN